MVGQTVGDQTIVQKFCTIGQYLSQVKVGRTNHVGQERSNWTYCQYKGHLTHIKETHKDCHMNLGQYFQIGHWLDKLKVTRQLSKSSVPLDNI